ncbi:MAG: hypothetical protein QXO21_04630 [Candidatus Anstonellales archaeon]
MTINFWDKKQTINNFQDRTRIANQLPMSESAIILRQNLFTRAESTIYVSFKLINPLIYYKTVSKLLKYAAGNPVTKILYFEGHPGTGKTHFALNEFRYIIDELKKAIGLMTQDEKAYEKLLQVYEILKLNDFADVKKRLADLMKDDFISHISDYSIFYAIKELSAADINETNVNYYRSISSMLLYSLIDNFKIYDIDEFANAIEQLKLFFGFDEGKESKIDSIDSYLVVLPALASSTDFLNRTIYVFNSGIKEEQTISILELLNKVISQRKFVVLILDELSELPHRQGEEEKSPKNLNEFFDGINSRVIDQHPIPSITLTIRVNQLSKKDRKMLEELKINIDNLFSNEILLRALYGNLSNNDLAILQERLLNLSKSLECILSDDSNNKSLEIYQISIPTPRKLFVIATGNIRSNNNPSGHFVPDSTRERLDVIYFGYPNPEQIKNFLTHYVNALCNDVSLSKYSEELKNFVQDLFSTYLTLINLNNSNEAINLPSIRVLKNYILNFVGFLKLNEQFFPNLFLQGKSNIMITHYKFSDMYVGVSKRRNLEKVHYNSESLSKFKEIFLEDYKNFLLSNLILTCRLPTGQLTLMSESKDGTFLISQIMRKHLDSMANLARVVKQTPDSDPSNQVHDMFVLTLQEPLTSFKKNNQTSKGSSEITYYYSHQQLLTLVSVCSSLISGQRFLLFTGESQEGKSAMVHIAYRILSEFYKNSFSQSIDKFDSPVRMVSIKPDQLSIIDVGVRVRDDADGKEFNLQESDLVKELRDAQKQDKILIIKIDEIDLSTEHSQQLNSLLTKEKIIIGEEEFDLSNIRIIATMNLSSVYLDNFLNRSLVYVFISDLQVPKIQLSVEHVINLRDYIFLYDKLNNLIKNEAITLSIVEKIFSTLFAFDQFIYSPNNRNSFIKQIKEILDSHSMKVVVDLLREGKLNVDDVVSHIIVGFLSIR